MDEFKIEKWTLEDGRRAERRIADQKNCDDGTSERLVELHVEDERPLRLKQRVIEKSKPIIYERKIETIDEKTGKVVDQKIESIEPKVQMQIVDHISTIEEKVVAQSVEPDCHVTKQEMIDTIIEAVKAMQPVQVQAQAQDSLRIKKQKSSNQKANNLRLKRNSNEFETKLNSLGLVDEIAKKVDKPISINKAIIYGIIVIEVAILAYLVFFT